jgi:hypothetical protein
MHVFKPSVEVHQMMKRAILTGLCIVLAFGVAGSFTGVAFSRQIQPSGIRQIQALLEEKAHRTPAQRKLDSHLHLAGQVARGVLSTRQIPAAANAAKMLKFDARQRVHVDIRGTVSKGLLAEIAALGGTVESSQVQYGAIRAWLPLLKAEALARRADVSFIEPAVMPILNGQLSAHPPRTQRLPAQQREKLRSQLESALRQLEARRSPVPPRREILNTAPVNTDGLISEGADLVQNEGITGDGVKVGVLSDGVDSLASMQIAGNLPNNVTVLSGQAGSGDEGTAMLEIVYDLAPGAELYFATADDSPAQMATNIESLSLAGCNIIVDDVTFLDEGVFQDDVIARAIDVITLNGVLYFSSAGNSGNLDSGTSGTWEGDFDGTGGTIDPIDTIEGQPVTVHAFDASHNYDQVTAASPIGGLTVLQWSDPLGASCNDYDLFHMDSSLQTVIEASNNPQECSEDPLEYVSAPPAGDVIVIVLYSGSPRALNLSTNRGRLAINTAGATFGHNAASSVVTVAATPAQNTIFTAGNQSPESYSSDGPRKIFYYPYGIPLTAGNYLFGTGGGTTLSKVDLTAADCGQSAVPGFDPFCGTSAAAPTAAAIAALIMSAAPTLTPSEVVSVMKSTALAPHAGFNSRTVGAGIAMANSSVDSVLVPLASFSPSSINLGTSPVGTNSSPGIVTLTNTGGGQFRRFPVHLKLLCCPGSGGQLHLLNPPPSHRDWTSPGSPRRQRQRRRQSAESNPYGSWHGGERLSDELGFRQPARGIDQRGLARDGHESRSHGHAHLGHGHCRHEQRRLQPRQFLPCSTGDASGRGQLHDFRSVHALRSISAHRVTDDQPRWWGQSQRGLALGDGDCRSDILGAPLGINAGCEHARRPATAHRAGKS